MNQILRDFEAISSRGRECDNQESCFKEEVDDDFDAFIRERTKYSVDESVDEDKDDPFASFVQERVGKVQSVQEIQSSNNFPRDLIDFSEGTVVLMHSCVYS